MMLSNSILIFLSIVCLSVSSDIPINTNEKKTNTKSNLYDQQCSKQLTYFDSALLTRESWALEGLYQL